MLKPELSVNLITASLEKHLKAANFEYMRGLLLGISSIDEMSDVFYTWTDYLHWAELAYLRRLQEKAYVP